MPLIAFSFALVFFLDAMGYFSLWLANWTTQEVKAVFFILPLLIGGAFFRFGARITSRTLFLTFAALFLIVGVAIFRIHLNVSIVLTAALPSFHALVFLSNDRSRFRYWRVGVSLFEIMLATSTAPELYMFFLVTIYSLLALFLLSLFYLEASYLEHDSEMAHKPVPRSFFRASALLAGLIFLTAGILFPILPRSSWFEGYSADRSLVGYTEKIEVAQMNNFFDNGPPKIVMRLFLPKDITRLPMFLVRGRALEVYNDSNWTAAVKRPDRTPPQEGGMHVHVIREDINSDILPVPYGTVAVQLDDGRALKRVVSREWSEFFSGRHGRAAYTIHVKDGLAWSPEDMPREIMRQSPDKSGRLHGLAAELAKNTKNDDEKIKNLLAFFHKNNFRASMNIPPSVGGEPIDAFIFKNRVGHCELFASSSALLLRAMGIPARLIVGFRAARAPENGVLSVYNSDAHAWVEAWVAEKNAWLPLDPTPLVFKDETHNWLEDKYDLLGAYWYRYILSYDADARQELITFLKVNSLKLAKIALEILSVLLFFRISRILFRRWLVYWRLPRQRKIAKRVYRRFKGRIPAPLLYLYERLRFGPLLPESEVAQILAALGRD